jgi:hypothetical protein
MYTRHSSRVDRLGAGLRVARRGTASDGRPDNRRVWPHGSWATLGLAGCVIIMGAELARAQGDPIAAMKGDLRRLVSANEVYHAKTTKYAGDVSALPAFKPSPGVAVTILGATAGGWSAKATASGLPGKSCVIYAGSVSPAPKTDAEGRSGPEAVAVCDRP